jgi:hypothetical protein
MKTVDPVSGEEREEVFQFQFHLEVTQFQVQQGWSEVRKEDILDFAHGILQEMNRRRAAGGEIDGLALDREDLWNVRGGEVRKLLKHMSQLIGLVKSIDRLSGEGGPRECLNLQKGSASAEDELRFEEQGITLSLQVTRLDMAGSDGGPEAPPVEAIPSQ